MYRFFKVESEKSVFLQAAPSVVESADTWTNRQTE